MKRTVKVFSLAAILVLGMATTIKIDNNKYFEIVKNIEIFTNLYKEINTYYVDDLDPGKLMRTGIDAMMESLDPFTNYISESDIEGYRYMTEGKYNGIGAMSKLMGDYVTITELYQDQPADQAGLKAGDKLIQVDGQDAKGKTPEQINEILRGSPGSAVELMIRRLGRDSDFKISLVRGEVKVPNVPYSGMINEDIGYIALTTFTRNAGRNVAAAMEELKKEHPNLKGVVFDLRGNGGGLLSEAVNISNVFIPKGELVATTKGKVKDWDRSFKTLNQPVDTDIPLVVLINKNSASASEIVSGVMQDYDRGILLGQRSYGKGLVQNTRDIGYHAKVKMTTAKYYIPSHRCIQSVEYKNGEPVDIPDDKRTKFKTRAGRTVLDGGGVTPDIPIKLATEAPLVKSLINQNMIFDFVTLYSQKIDSIASIQDFHFTQFDEFTKFLAERDFSYHTESEKLLNKLKESNKKEGLDLAQDIDALALKLKVSKQSEVSDYKEVVTDLIEKEIAGRFHYQKGKIQMGLRNDEEIRRAIQVINDKENYKKVLGS